MKWFKDFNGIFNIEKARTIIKVEGNKLHCFILDSKSKPIKKYEVKFKNSSKLKKFWERYVINKTIDYYAKEKVFWSTRILNISR